MPRVSQRYLDNRKKEIATSAIKVFANKGFAEASMQDIMNAAKVSRGGLYAHFENIDAVFIESLKIDDSIQEQRLKEIRTDNLLMPQLKSWIKTVITYGLENEHNLIRAKSEFLLSHSGEDVPYVLERHENLVNALMAFFAIGVEKVEFKSDVDYYDFSKYLIALIDGVMLQQNYNYQNPTKIDVLLSYIETTLSHIQY